ncbi:CoA-ligase [Mycena amicta]|nr:CoA-ligase [Mycena amicta]
MSLLRLPHSNKHPRLNIPSPHSRPQTRRTRTRCAYDSTVQNLAIGAHTRVIFQGFTGRQATANAIESLAWGTQIVGGVTPGKSRGFHPAPALAHLPVFPTVKEAVKELKPDATGIYVAAGNAFEAIKEALEAEIPLIVAVAEHIPLHEMLHIHSILRTQSKSRLVGANAPGIISALGHCRIGFQPLPCFSPGHVGIVAKSGTLSYEAVAALTRAGIGQSLCIGMGGDILAGTDFVDALEVLTRDPDTHGIVLIGEIGGTAEEEAAEWISQYNATEANPKPIAGLVAGKIVRPGTIMGHAGAFASLGESTAQEKYSRLDAAGVRMVQHPSDFGLTMSKLLPEFYASSSSSSSSPFQSQVQRRGLHTRARRSVTHTQVRSLFIDGPAAEELCTRGLHPLVFYDGEGPEFSALPGPEYILSMTVDRSARMPCILVGRVDQDSDLPEPENLVDIARFPLEDLDDLRKHLPAISKYLTVPLVPKTRKLSEKALSSVLLRLHIMFGHYDAISVSVTLLRTALASKGFLVHSPRFVLDDAAFRSAGRHVELHTNPSATRTLDPQEHGAQKDHGIVYVKLGPQPLNRGDDPLEYARHAIGTLVNGAGLAMNTVDMLSSYGDLSSPVGVRVRAANFLDTGGKATAETVKASFALLLADPRVKVIFVNVFGGLTLGDMIARGILLAFHELKLEERAMPVVVRIRGTNEEEGQRMLRESGLKGLWSFDDFGDAAKKCVELAEAALKGE